MNTTTRPPVTVTVAGHPVPTRTVDPIDHLPLVYRAPRPTVRLRTDLPRLLGLMAVPLLLMVGFGLAAFVIGYTYWPNP